MRNAMQRATAVSIAPGAAAPSAPAAERAAGPSPVGRKRPPKTASKETSMSNQTDDRTLPLADLTAEDIAGALGRLAELEARFSAQAAQPAQQAVLAQVPAPVAAPAPAPVAAAQEPVVSASGGYTKTKLGTVTLVGNVGHSKQIVYKTVGGKSLVEFSLAARTFGSEEPTWYRATMWEAAEDALELVRQGTFVQVKGQGVQSQSHKTGRVFLDVTVQRIAAGPEKGQQLSVAASRSPQRSYFARLWDALRGR